MKKNSFKKTHSLPLKTVNFEKLVNNGEVHCFQTTMQNQNELGRYLCGSGVESDCDCGMEQRAVAPRWSNTHNKDFDGQHFELRKEDVESNYRTAPKLKLGDN